MCRCCLQVCIHIHAHQQAARLTQGAVTFIAWQASGTELPDAQRDALLPTVEVQLDETCSLQHAGSHLAGRLAVVRDVGACAAVTTPSGISAAGLLLGSLQHHELSKPLMSDSSIPVWFIDPTAAADILESKGRLKITTLRLPLDAALPANAQQIVLKASASVLPGNKLTIRGTS